MENLQKTPATTSKCGAAIKMGDDYGDNHATFICGLDRNHDGDHLEEGTLYGQFPYRLSWKGDMREKCSFCNALVPQCRMCHFCDKECCQNCYREDHPWCKECASQGKSYEQMSEDHFRDLDRKFNGR